MTEIQTAPTPDAVTVELSAGTPVTITGSALTLALTDVADSRCPVGARCVWAGHAAVTLSVSTADGKFERIVIGTESPSAMALPFKADFGGYRFSLMQLEPAPQTTETVTLAQYRATVHITQRELLPTP